MKRILKQFVKRVTFEILNNEKLFDRKISQHAAKNSLYILNFHRVCEEANSAYEAIHPEHFDQLIAWLLKRFQIVTFTELNSLTESCEKPALIISFDDGYKDFIDIVMPILNKHGVCANQNIIPSCVMSGMPPMNVGIQDFIGQAPASLLKEIDFFDDKTFVDPNNRIAAGIAISRKFKNLSIDIQKQHFGKLKTKFARFDAFQPTQMLSLAEVQEVSRSCEIGSHSFEHASMASQSNDYLEKDAIKCIEWFQQNISQKPDVYAFPNGDYVDKQLDILHNLGYKYILAVGEKYSLKGNLLHNRFTMYGQSLPELKYRAAGQNS